MTIKDLLVHVDLSKAGKARTEYAFGLAEAYRAHVIGVGFSPLGIVPYYGAPDLVMPVPVEYFQSLRDEAKKALDDFMTEGERRGVSVETRLIESSTIDLPDEMTMHARYVDLAVVGQPEQSEGMAGPQHALIEELLFSSGRPVLVVPWAGKGNPAPKTVMVAWDASGTAARALADAMPILKEAKKVVVLVATEGGPSAHGDEPGADVALHLARHNVEVEARHIPTGSDISVADLLLSQASDIGAEMIVMGGYHHSRVREFIIGGVTRTIIDTMTVPVLMSH